MIDLHAHILPGLDEGVADLAASLALSRRYVEAGFSSVVATPHVAAGEMPADYAHTVDAAVYRLNRVLRQRSVALSVLPGMAVTLDAELPQRVVDGTVLTLAGTRHLLVETPLEQLPLNWRSLVFVLAARGVTVLFAHPERCEQILKDWDILYAMLAAGARLQVSWDSFAGAFGPQSMRLACWMADKGLIHCLATDSRDLQSRHPGSIRQIAAELGERIGAHTLWRLSCENPLRVLRGLAMREMEMPALQAVCP